MNKQRQTVNFMLVLLVLFILASRAFADYDRFRSVSDDVFSLLSSDTVRSGPLTTGIRNSGTGTISYVVETERLKSSGTVSALIRQTSRRPAFDTPSAIVFLFLLSCIRLDLAIHTMMRITADACFYADDVLQYQRIQKKIL